jgi:hypothetical protein
LIWDGFESQFLAELWPVVEILEQGSFVVPPVECFEQEDSEQLAHLVGCRVGVPVVGSELVVCQRILAGKLVNRDVGLVLNQTVATVRMSSSSAASECWSYSGVASYAGQSVNRFWARCRKTVRRD